MSEAILRINNIYKSFGNNHIHKGISFNVLKGESLGLLGSSGSGKSVLLRSLIGLEFIDHGEIFYKDRRIDNLKESELLSIRLQLSYSFQNGALFDSLNVFNNIAFPLIHHTKLSRLEIQNKVFNILNLMDLKGKENLMPSDLSGGMKKRIGMARSLILDPEIILYDEPTAGLDPNNTKNIVTLMKKFKSLGQACIFVTHDIPAALQLCDRIIVIDNGNIIFNDGPKEFENSSDKKIKQFQSHEELYDAT